MSPLFFMMEIYHWCWGSQKHPCSCWHWNLCFLWRIFICL